MTVIAFLNLQVGFLIYSPFLSPIQDPRCWNKEAKSPKAVEATANSKDLGCGFPFENPTPVTPLPSVCVWVGGAVLLKELWGEVGGGDLLHQFGPI